MFLFSFINLGLSMRFLFTRWWIFKLNIYFCLLIFIFFLNNWKTKIYPQFERIFPLNFINIKNTICIMILTLHRRIIFLFQDGGQRPNFLFATFLQFIIQQSLTDTLIPLSWAECIANLKRPLPQVLELKHLYFIFDLILSCLLPLHFALPLRQFVFTLRWHYIINGNMSYWLLLICYNKVFVKYKLSIISNISVNTKHLHKIYTFKKHKIGINL